MYDSHHSDLVSLWHTLVRMTSVPPCLRFSVLFCEAEVPMQQVYRCIRWAKVRRDGSQPRLPRRYIWFKHQPQGRPDQTEDMGLIVYSSATAGCLVICRSKSSSDNTSRFSFADLVMGNVLLLVTWFNWVPVN